MVSRHSVWLGLVVAVSQAGCHFSHPPIAPETPPIELPPSLKGHAFVLSKAYMEAEGVKPELVEGEPGQGKMVKGQWQLVKLTEDIPVWRLWAGPQKRDSHGNTNEYGAWWSADAPTGTRKGYRAQYQICKAWNDLTWVTRCTLKKGAVVVVGPGNSVAPPSCGEGSTEAYPENDHDWQMWISKPWERHGAGGILECPETELAFPNRYPNDCAEVSHAGDGNICASSSLE
jgi:hypothetical protein